jgi:PAS domain S-box-containing protein
MRDFFQMETRYIHRDGHTFWGLTNFSLVRDLAGSPLTYVAQVQDITDRKRMEQRLKTEHSVVSILAEALDLREAAPRLLRAVCETTEWDVGMLWIADQQADVLSCVSLWHIESDTIGGFSAIPRPISLTVEASLPGRVWATRKPVWIVDITQEPNFLHTLPPVQAGLRGGFGLPIPFGGEILAVAEFFSRGNRQPDDELLRMFDSLGSQIGQFIERKRVEGGLRLFRALIDRITDGIEVIDPATGRFVDVNEHACLAHGYTREEFLSLSVTDVDPIVAARSWGELLKEGLLEGRRTFDSFRQRKSGSKFPVEVNFTTFHLEREYMVAVVRDITERRATDALLRLRDRAIQAVTQGILITDPSQPDNPIVYSSPGFEQITGYTNAEVVGRNCRFLQGAGTDPEAVARIRVAVRDGLPCTVELQNYRKDGSPFWNELSVSPVKDEAGLVTHCVGVQTDVTARRSLAEQFRQSQKMEAVGRLAGGIAHDFNNILTVISGYTKLLLEEAAPDDPWREAVEEIDQAGRRAADVIRQLLTFSRQTILEPRVVDPNALVLGAEKMLCRLIGEDVTLSVDLSPDAGHTLVDPGQLEQALVNLCVNARDAMPEGGKLTIRTRNSDLKGDRPDIKPGSYVIISVTDSGEGMDAATKTRIFEPFYTTKGVGKGTGLGLSMLHGFVCQTGGFVEVLSEPGQGTTFLVFLPQVASIPAPAVQVPRPTMPRGTETILLVEDEDTVRQLIGGLLKAWGYTVLAADHGSEAVRLATGHTGQIGLLVADVVMPGGMGGRKVAELVVISHPETKVLYISGYTDDALKRHGVTKAAGAFLQKPFSPAGLAHKVRQVLDS